MKMYKITEDQTAQIALNQPQAGNFFHWYKILGFYLISASFYFLVSFFEIYRRTSFYSQTYLIRLNLVILALFYLIAPIIYLWKLKRSKNTTYSTFSSLKKLFFLGLTGVLIASLLWAFMESQIRDAQYWQSGNWSVILSDRVEMFVFIFLVLVGFYIFGYWLLSRSKKQPILLETSSVNINTQSFPKEQASNSSITKDDLLQLQHQQLQVAQINSTQENYTYNEFITNVFNQAEWWKLGKAFYTFFLIYLGILSFHLLTAPDYYNPIFGIYFILAAVVLVGGSIGYTYHVYKIGELSRLSRDVSVVKGILLLLISASLMLIINEFNNYLLNRFRNVIHPIGIDVVLAFILLVGLGTVYQIKTRHELRHHLYGRYQFRNLKKSAEAVSLTKQFLVSTMQNLQPKLTDVTPLTVNDRIQVHIEDDLKRLQLILEAHAIRYHSSEALIKYCLFLLRPITVSLHEIVVTSYTKRLLDNSVDPEDVTIDSETVWNHLHKQLMQWESELAPI